VKIVKVKESYWIWIMIVMLAGLLFIMRLSH